MSSGREISKLEKEKQKYIQEKCQSMLNDMLRDEDNKYCVDCDAKGPRWASWNLGIFLCIRCAGIHRNLGVHISRVKSVNLDTWTPEQVVTMQQMGNSRARAVYEANLPDSFRRPQTDVALENFIRAKYETHKYIAQEWVKPPPPKVNWDAEVEESLKKKKDKKQVQNDIGPLPTAIPKPKPTSSSPATVTKLSNPIKKETPVQKSPELNPPTQSSASDDLLGLITGPPPTNVSPTDPFASPVKAPTSADSNNTDDLGSIFAADVGFDPNQGLKMTKESILSLYGQAPSNNVNPFASQGMFASTGATSNPFPQLASTYNSNVMGQGPAQGQNPYGNMQNDLGILNGGGGGSNNMFTSQPDASQIQQQMFGLNISNYGQQQGAPAGMPAFGNPNSGLPGNQQGFPQLNNPMGFNPLSMPNKPFLPAQTNFPGYPASNLAGLNSSGGGNANQHIFPNDGPIAATNLWK